MNSCVKAVVNKALSMGIEVVGVVGGYAGLINGDRIPLTQQSVNNIVGTGGTFLYSSRCPEFKTEEGIMRAVETCKKNEIDAVMRDLMQRRITKQPLEYPSAGSVFKRPAPDLFVGKMIEDSGLKGYTIGGAQVSEKHAGFIINIGGATAKDVLDLVEHIKGVILENYGVELECEIRRVGSGE